MLRLFRYLAFPISLIYALVVHIRNLLYDWGLLASHSPDTPTICVGNLSVGGTGKTPMIEYLVRMLDDHRLALLSRGYKRKSKGFVLADARSSVWDLGDEPYQLHRKFPELAVAVDGDRRRGIRELQRLVSPELILLDDAFQHRRVRPALSILLTAYDKLYVDDRYLPTGSLRDAKGEASRADLILVTKCPGPLSKGQREPVVKKLAPKNGQKVLFAHLEYGDKILDGTGGSLELGELRGREVALVTGIASPGPLVEHLGSLGIAFVHFEHGDHHDFSQRDISAFADHQIVLCTEKDFVRLEGRVDHLYYLPVAHRLDAGDRKELEERVRGLL